ncbi:hypothetical protein AST12_08530 [Staphylococcus succinus]|nr:hypothetical protein AST12_08530 [Staphylococcus succinus]
MKKIPMLLLSSFLLLGACNNSEDSGNDDKQEAKSSAKDKKKSNDGDTVNDNTKNTEEPNEVSTSKVANDNEDTEQPQIDVSNVND